MLGQAVASSLVSDSDGLLGSSAALVEELVVVVAAVETSQSVVVLTEVLQALHK